MVWLLNWTRVCMLHSRLSLDNKRIPSGFKGFGKLTHATDIQYINKGV